MGRQRGTAICPDFLPLLALLLLSVAPASVQSQQGTPQECGALADKHNIIPGYSWGSADATTQQRWTTQDCDANICIYWKTTYNVVPWATWGTLPDKFKPSWSWVQPKHQASCGQLSGQLSATECAAVASAQGIRPGFTFGSAVGDDSALIYLMSSCDVKICEAWRHQYGVIPWGSYGKLPENLKPSWNYGRPAAQNRTCNSLSGPLDAPACSALVKAFNIRPGFSMGTATEEARNAYNSSVCDYSICTAWRDEYGVVPFANYGTLPTALRPSWDFPRSILGNRTCNSLVGPVPPESCGALVEKYGIIPGPTTKWGTATEEVRKAYREADCDINICSYWRAKYGIVPNVLLGSLPEKYKEAYLWRRPTYNNRNCDGLGPAGARLLTPAECGDLANRFQIQAGFSWGSSDSATQQQWTASDCDAQICAYWKSAYGIVPHTDLGALPGVLAPSWHWVRPKHNANCNRLSGTMKPRDCGAMVETYGMQPGFSMGNASAEVQATYNASNCNSLVCEDWKLKYGVIPWKTYGRLPAHLIASWDYARPLDNRRSCNSLSGPLYAPGCGALTKAYNILPGFSWGSAPAEARDIYNSSMCDLYVCEAWRQEYGNVPFIDYGTLPAQLRPSWEFPRSFMQNRSCNLLSGPINADTCGGLVELYGIIPGPTTNWGTAHAQAREGYLAGACDDAICTYWRTKYGVVPYNTWGSLPDRYKAAWDWARPSAGNRTCNQLAGADLPTLARRFAPVLKFHKDALGYPMTAQTYFNAGCHTKPCSMQEWLSKPFDPKAHVYYVATTCGNQVRIKYHFFYAWQAPCMTVPAKGAHQADWEAVTLLLSADLTRVAAVTYSQHGGWYTRVAGRNGFETVNGRPVVYVGLQAHGSYHDAQSAPAVTQARCLWFGDGRGGGITWDVGTTTLVDLTAPAKESWIAATRAAPNKEIKWEAGQGISFSTRDWAPTCDMDACTGSGLDISAQLGLGLGEVACSRSQCRTGWKETGVVGCYRCPTGYIDCGGTCAKGTSGWDCVNPFNWDRKVYETSYYDYRLPANDVGLL